MAQRAYLPDSRQCLILVQAGARGAATRRAAVMTRGRRCRMEGTRRETFGNLLRRHRRAVGLTQQGLAERASISEDTISNIERGVPHVPRKDTLELLTDALRLMPEDRVAFFAAARTARDEQMTAARHSSLFLENGPLSRVPLPPTPLVGREREFATARDLLLGDTVRLLTITGVGGVGKTRL